MKLLTIFTLLSCFLVFTTNAQDMELTPDQITRKKASIEFLKAHNIPYIEHLPYTESEAETSIRTKEEIINRAFALCYLGLKSEGLEENYLRDFERKYKIIAHFSPEELKYVKNQNPSQQEHINANWRYESLHVLLWALGYVEELKLPNQVCVVAQDVKLIFERSREEFTNTAKLRSKQEILDAADLIYRIDWACVNARVTQKEMPANLDASIVYERHYVLNWLIRYMDQDWDDVSTDT